MDLAKYGVLSNFDHITDYIRSGYARFKFKGYAAGHASDV
jgi:hypothetical protein